VNGFEALSSLPKTRLSVENTAKGLRIRNAGDRISFMVRIKGVDVAGRYATPVHYSENHFSLLPGEDVESEIEAPKGTAFSVSAWNVDGERAK